MVVPGGTAATAGVQAGDCVLALDDSAVADVSGFVACSARLLGYWKSRNGQQSADSAKLAQALLTVGGQESPPEPLSCTARAISASRSSPTRGTGNSRYEQEIDAFAARVQARGGRLVRHVFLRRGRIFWQKSRETLLRQVREQLGADIEAAQ
jgi:hypothetical protein